MCPFSLTNSNIFSIPRDHISKAYSVMSRPPVRILEEYMWEALFSFRPLVVQAISFIVISGPISPTKRIFGVTTWNLGIMVTLKI
ncbi:hypothetical protein E2C01_086149 [Portunus trituberculatus]|uniref:Uncharacterized protein n=1 Tax=Portunus trituberculatus TaxID=210409 RepID=A0A5B7J4P2_PORTR|nr:hypothetical protein [Portunus trituberculatus]